MHALASTVIVNRSSKMTTGVVGMVDQIKRVSDDSRIRLAFQAFNALGVGFAILAVLMGWVTTGNSNAHDVASIQASLSSMQSQVMSLQAQVSVIASMQTQLAGLTTQVSRLADRMENAVRPDQLQTIQDHLHALDTRTDQFDGRLGKDERDQSHYDAIIDTIQGASDQSLRRSK